MPLGSLEPGHVEQVGMNSGATLYTRQSSLASGHQADLQSKGFLGENNYSAENLFYKIFLLGEELPGIPAAPQCILPEQC